VLSILEGGMNMDIYEELFFYFQEKCKILENNIRIIQEKIEYADQQLSQFNKRKELYKNIDGSSTRNVFSPLKVEKKEKKVAYHDQMSEWTEKKEELLARKADYQEKLEYYKDKCQKVRTAQTEAGQVSLEEEQQRQVFLEQELLPQMEKVKNKLDFVKKLMNSDVARAKMELNQATSAMNHMESMIKNYKH
jgi:hypothetical protein